MFFFKTFGSTTVKELRKNQGLTAARLAQQCKVGSGLIKKIDNMQFKRVPEPLKSRIEPILRGRNLDKMPW
jgi:transcriptional regulator with XRE-family HTH domain